MYLVMLLLRNRLLSTERNGREPKWLADGSDAAMGAGLGTGRSRLLRGEWVKEELNELRLAMTFAGGDLLNVSDDDGIDGRGGMAAVEGGGGDKVGDNSNAVSWADISGEISRCGGD